MSKLTEMLRRHEGVESHAYMCSQNFWTIGVGRNVDPGNNGAAKGLGLSDDEIDYSLYDTTHPNGSIFFGGVIENISLLEAFPGGKLKYFLINL